MIIRISDEILHCVETISSSLSRIISQLELPDVPIRPDLNIAAKDFVCELLNQIYGWIPATDIPDIPSIDLTDAERTTAVYVTTDNSTQNIRSLLTDFKSHPGKSRFSKLIVLVVTNREPPASVKQINQYPHFVGSSDLWNIQRLIHNLENIELEQLERIIGYLGSDPGCPWIPRYTPTFRLPQLPAHDSFIPGSRVREIEALRKTLWNNKPVFLWGAAGMGKTMLAGYAARLYTPPQGAYYLRYQIPLDESVEAMRETILHADLAGYRFRGTDNEQHDLEYQERLQILRRDYRDALLVIDEFDRPGKTLEALQAESSYHDLLDTGIRLIFTTRTPVGDYGIEVGPLPQHILMQFPRVSFVYRHLNKSSEPSRPQEIGDNTLMIILTAQTCNMMNYSSRLLLQELEKCALKADGIQRKHLLMNTLLAQSFASQNLSAEENADIAALTTATLQFACIMAEEGFGYSFLADCLPDKYLNILSALHQLGWISSFDGVLMIPRMIREFCLQQQIICPLFFDNLWNSFALHPHDPALLRRIARCFCHASDMLPDPDGNNALRAGRLLELIGQHTSALRYTMRAVELREKQLPADHPDLATVYSDAGQLYSILEMPEKALEYHEGALDILKEILDPNHPDLAVAYDRVADAKKALRRQFGKKQHYI